MSLESETIEEAPRVSSAQEEAPVFLSLEEIQAKKAALEAQRAEADLDPWADEEGTKVLEGELAALKAQEAKLLASQEAAEQLVRDAAAIQVTDEQAIEHILTTLKEVPAVPSEAEINEQYGGMIEYNGDGTIFSVDKNLRFSRQAMLEVLQAGIENIKWVPRTMLQEPAFRAAAQKSFKARYPGNDFETFYEIALHPESTLLEAEPQWQDLSPEERTQKKEGYRKQNQKNQEEKMTNPSVDVWQQAMKASADLNK